DELTREERVKTERAGTVTLAVALRAPLEVEEVRALHEPAHALENRVLRPRRAARSLVRVLERERAPELVARLVIELVDRIEAVDVRDAVIASEAHGRELRAEPTGPVAGLEGLELVSFGARVEKDEARNRAREIAERLRDDRAERGTCEGRPRLLPAHETVDRLEMLRRLGRHRTHDRDSVEHRRGKRHELAHVHAGDLRRNAAKRPAGRPPGLRVPRLELARPAAEPKEDATLPASLRLLRDRAAPKEPGPTENGCRARSDRAFEEAAAMDRVIRLAAGREWRTLVRSRHEWGLTPSCESWLARARRERFEIEING